jgi:hypothetical protein
MNTLITNLLQARNNPHVFWPVAIVIALRVGMQVFFKAMDIYAPHLQGQNAAMQDMLEPYVKDLTSALQGYATVAAATSGPAAPPLTTPPANVTKP